MAGQSVMDRVAAVKHSIAGQGLAKSVCKATTEEIIGPKKKHLDFLLQCTNEPNVSIPQMADLLIERTQHQSWVVVFKSLISIHNLMNLGNERFTQYLASNNCSFNLSGFVDKGGVQGYDMSTYIRRYAKYLNEKAVSYRSMAFDFCKVKRGKDDGLLRTMNTEKLLKTLPVLQQQLDALLEFDCTPNELTNGVITACFMLLFKDLIRLFACYNDGIINLLEKYFDMNKKQCKDALDLYKRFLVRMDKVSEFLKVAENMGIDKGDIPDLAKDDKPLPSLIQKAPASLLDALEQHLASLEGKKSATTPTGSSKPSGFTTALNNMSSNTFTVSEAERKRILDEENQQLQRHKAAEESGQPAAVEMPAGEEEGEMDFEQKLKDNTSPQKLAAVAAAAPSSSTSNPFSSSSSSTSQPGQQDLFGSPVNSNAAAGKASDDLLSLNSNPFASNVQDVMATAYQAPANSTPNNPFGTPAFQSNGVGAASNSNNFDADFANAFNNTGTSNAQGFSATSSSAASSAGAPPGLDLSSPLVPVGGGGGEDMMMMPSDIGGVGGGGSALQPSPSPISSTSPAVGGPFSGLEGLVDQPPLSVSPCPSPFGGLGGLSPGGSGSCGLGLGDITGGGGSAPMTGGGGLFGGPTVGITPTSGFGGIGIPSGSVSPGGMMPGAPGGVMHGAGGFGIGQTMGLGGGVGGPAAVNPQLFGGPPIQQQLPQQQLPPTSAMAVPPPGAGAKLGAYMGLSGSPVRVMTRGGVSPGPSSLSSSPSGPGLEDAVKALGLNMSPSKTANNNKSKGLMAGNAMTQNRPTSPGQQTMSGGIEPVMASGQAASIMGCGFDTGAPGGYKGFEHGGGGEIGGLGVGEMGGDATALGVGGGGSQSEGIGGGGGDGTQAGSGFDAFGDVMAPMNKSPSHHAQNNQAAKPVVGDLDSSLASLATNLNVSGGTGQLKKDHQWQPKGENKLTGGNTFQKQPIAASTTNTVNPQWGAQPGFQQPNMMPGVPGGPMMYGQQMGMPMGQPMMGMTPQPMPMQQPGMMMGQQPMMYGAGPPRMASPAVGAFGQQPIPSQQQQAPSSQTGMNDPFGAL